jgi:hypothetical protein
MSIPIPLIEVSHLPSASSYYNSLTKTLGITFLSATPSREGNHFSPPCLNFGYAQPGPSPHSDSATSIDPTEEIEESEEVVFQVIQSLNPRISHVYLWAPNPKSVKDFYAKSLVLNKSSGVESVFTSEEEEGDSEDEEEGEILRCRTTDLDGNMLEAVYSPRRQNAPRRTLLVHETSECTEKEARRVLEWQQDVARSLSESQSPSPSREDARSQISTRSEVERRRERIAPVRRSDSYPVTQAEQNREHERERERGGAAPGAPMRLVRRDMITREHYRRDELDRERKRDSGGAVGKGVIGLGTLIGVAAGAAITYSLVRGEGPSSNSISRTPPSMPPRRASYGADTYTQAARGVEMERVPARSYVSAREEGPRDMGRDRYVQYTIATPQPPPPPTRNMGIPVHELRRIEESSQGSSSQRSGRERSHTTRERSRSEVGGRYERPLASIPTRERRERRDRSPPSFDSERRVERSHTTLRRSESTVKTGPPQVEYLSGPMPLRQIGPTGIRMRSGGGGGSYVGEIERERELERVRAVPRSVVEVRGPLGYAASVAPSDSVSSVGGKRERERLRDRMREHRGGW